MMIERIRYLGICGIAWRLCCTRLILVVANRVGSFARRHWMRAAESRLWDALLAG